MGMNNPQQQYYYNTGAQPPHKSAWRWKKFLLTAGLPVLFVLLAILGVRYGIPWLCQRRMEEQQHAPWAECPMQVPGDTKVIFLRKHIHPFLAEYDRALRIERPGKASVTLDLPSNTGGRTMIKVYTCCAISPEGEETLMLLLIDQQWEMLVDLKKAEMANDPMSGMSTEKALEAISEKKYIGRLDARETSLKFIPASESAEEPIATP